jgi:pantoate--beta-alanine ligase
MELIEDLTTLRRRVRAWRQAGDQVALVPTMGNLHRGHLRLVEEARAYAQRTVVSIFVNPMQFGPQEDFAAYPRTQARDRELLEAAGTDLLFAPSLTTVYPRPPEQQTRVEVPGLSDILCGASRPGHFVGVATVVCKLFNMVQPDLAVFGEKDFQQLLVIRRMTEDLCLPVSILGVPTVREADGLALSSRNSYLRPEERARAPAVRRALERAADGLRAGLGVSEVEQRAAQDLRDAGLAPDYVSIRLAADLAAPGPTDTDLVVLAAAWLGKTRLIDNLRVSRPAWAG